MEKFKLVMRKALIKSYYEDIIGKPKRKQNREYYELLKSKQILT